LTGSPCAAIYRGLINVGLEAIRLNPNVGHDHRDLAETQKQPSSVDARTKALARDSPGTPQSTSGQTTR
jgi:hypothetical protein